MTTKTSKSALVIMLLTFAGYALGYFNIFFVLPKYLTEAEIGIYRVLFDVAYLIYPFLQFGGINIVNKFFFEQKGNDGRLLGFSTFLFFVGLIIFTPIFLLNSEFILGKLGFIETYYSDYLKWIVLLLVLAIGMANLLGANLRNHRLVTGFNLYNSLWLRVAVSLAFTGFGLSFFDFDESIIFVTSLVLLGTIVLWIHSFYKTRTSSIPVLSVTGIGRTKMLGYGGVMLIGFGSTVFINKIDTLMTSGIIGLASAGVYSVAMAFSSIIEIPRRSVNQVLIPSISKAFTENDTRKIEEVYKESSITLFFMSSFLFLCMYLSIGDLLEFLPNSEMYLSGKWVVIILGAAKVFDALWGVNSEILILSKYYKYNIVLLVVLLFTTVGLNLIFINDELLITGTAIATAITVLLYNVIRGIILYWKLKVLPFCKSHLWILSTSLVVIILQVFISDIIQTGLLRIILNTILAGGMFLVLLVKFELSTSLTNYRAQLLKLFGIN